MDEKTTYAVQWNESAKHFYENKSYEWMCEHIEQYKCVLEIGCGVGLSTLSLLKHNHTVIAIDKNIACIERTKQILEENGYILDKDYRLLHADISSEVFWNDVLPKLNFDLVICWNVGTYWDNTTLSQYFPNMIQYGLTCNQIMENPESSYSELIIWNTCRIAFEKNADAHIIDRSAETVTENNDEYYCTLKDEFQYKDIVYDNRLTSTLSKGGRQLSTKGDINNEKILQTYLVSVLYER